MLAFYHQTKTPISFWYRWGLNPKSLIQTLEILPVELTGTHHHCSILIILLKCIFFLFTYKFLLICASHKHNYYCFSYYLLLVVEEEYGFNIIHLILL